MFFFSPFLIILTFGFVFGVLKRCRRVIRDCCPISLRSFFWAWYLRYGFFVVAEGSWKPNWRPCHRQSDEDRMQALRSTVRDTSRLMNSTGTDRCSLGERAERTLRGWPCVSDICQSWGDRQPTILPGDTDAYHCKVSTNSYGRSHIIQISKNAVAWYKELQLIQEAQLPITSE